MTGHSQQLSQSSQLFQSPRARDDWRRVEAPMSGRQQLARRRQVEADLARLRPTCRGCGQPFERTAPGRKFCRPSCRALVDRRDALAGSLFDGVRDA